MAGLALRGPQRTFFFPVSFFSMFKMLEKPRIRKYYITGIINSCQLSDFPTDEHYGGWRRRLPIKSLLNVGRQARSASRQLSLMAAPPAP